MKITPISLLLASVVALCSVLTGVVNLLAEEQNLPQVPEGFLVDVVAKEPFVRNPCVMTFDRRGRLYVGQGPQWRSPTPETPGDRVDLLLDDDGDGKIDRKKIFAEGFNSIQGLCWKGNDLWVANAPDLTIVRDLDGDDEADQYLRVYTGLGNLEHSLHGLNFGPDGKLYMSKGNSKGYNRLDQLAPKPFRELWGLRSPEGALDYTPIEVYTKSEYKRKYHTPPDDWGQQGGILRCDSNGRNLEIVARGFRNPWDIAFDDEFNWLGTDNDQTTGDRIFAPTFGSHFGWGHNWSFHWTGENHLPTLPVSAPLFEGSGAGITYYHANHFPEEYQHVFFINDWMKREVYLFRPKWDGALMKCADEFPTTFAHGEGGRSLPSSSGSVFDPTDIEVGPDGTLYILSWGHGYGATIKNGQQTDAGRVYRIRYKSRPLLKWRSEHRSKTLSEWTLDQLFEDLGSHVPSWRTDAQEELLRRTEAAKKFLFSGLKTLTAENHLTKAQQTWTLWTLGRMPLSDLSVDEWFLNRLKSDQTSEQEQIQLLRILAHRVREANRKESHELKRRLPKEVVSFLNSANARLRHAAVQSISQTKQSSFLPFLIELAAKEQDRVTFYSTWNAIRQLSSTEDRKQMLKDSRAGVRLAVLLGLFEENAVSVKEAVPFRNDSDRRIAELVESWLQKTGGTAPLIEMSPPPGKYAEPVSVTLKTSVKGASLTYTLDGSTPVKTSTRYTVPILIEQNTILKVLIEQNGTQMGGVVTGEYQIRPLEAWTHHPFISDLKAKSGQDYRIDWQGIQAGKRHYTDRTYHITHVPGELKGMPFLRTWNNDDRKIAEEWLSFRSSENVTLYVCVDRRVNAPLEWMKIGQPEGFQKTDLTLETTDPVFQLYKKRFAAGTIKLGGNLNHPDDSRRGNYIVIFDRPLIQHDEERPPAILNDVLSALSTASAEHGRELFLHPRGAGCVKCHQMEGRGEKLAPDLSDIGSRVKKPEVLIQSIIDPSAVITEGFAQQQIVTVQGRVYNGAVLEETGQSLKLVDSEGKVILIQKSEIEERIGTKLSPMPNGFAKLMTAQQIADIVAWLMTQKRIGVPEGFSFQDSKKELKIYFQKKRIATYLKDHGTMKRRGLVNVMTPTGIPITREFPPTRKDDQDHAMMHPGIWIGFGDLNGNDYWRLQAEVDFSGFTKKPVGTKETASFTTQNIYRPDKKRNPSSEDEVCTEITKYLIKRVPEGFLLLIDATFSSKSHDFYFGDQEESGLAVRVASDIRVQGGNGTILNDRSEKNGKEIWGKEAKWFDYSGTVRDREVGLMVIPDPSNERKSWLHARDYGVVVTNPFPKQPKQRREPYVKTWVRKGKPFQLRYAILIHDQPANQDFDRKDIYQQVLHSLKQVRSE